MNTKKVIGSGSALVAALTGGVLVAGAQPASALNVGVWEKAPCGTWITAVNDETNQPYIGAGDGFTMLGFGPGSCANNLFVSRAVYKRADGSSGATILYRSASIAASAPGDIPAGAHISAACFGILNGSAWDIRQINQGDSGSSPGCKFNIWA